MIKSQKNCSPSISVRKCTMILFPMILEQNKFLYLGLISVTSEEIYKIDNRFTLCILQFHVDKFQRILLLEKWYLVIQQLQNRYYWFCENYTYSDMWQFFSSIHFKFDIFWEKNTIFQILCWNRVHMQGDYTFLRYW